MGIFTWWATIPAFLRGAEHRPGAVGLPDPPGSGQGDIPAGSALTPPEPSAAGGFNHETVAHLHFHRCCGAQYFDGSVIAYYQITSGQCVAPPVQTKWCDPPPVGQNGRGHGVSEYQFSRNTFSTAMPPRAARCVAH